MKQLLKIYGLAKILVSGLAFYLNWVAFFGMIKTFNEINAAQVTGGSLGFILMLVFSFYLLNSGISDLKNKQITAPKFHWTGIIFGMIISCFLYFYSTAISFVIGIALISMIEAFRMLTKKTSNPTNETS